MILTGFNKVTGKFYSSTGLYSVFQTDSMQDCSLTFLGPTGHSGTFRFDKGKIYDTSGLFISTYNSGNPLKFEFAYETGKYTTWVNEELISANRMFHSNATTTLTGYVFSGGYTGNLDLSFSFYGNRPGLYFSPLRTSNLINFSGYILVTGAPAELLSFEPYNATVVTTPLGKFTSGNYSLSGAYFNSGSIVNTDFYFDFGLHNQDLLINVFNTGIPTGVINAAVGGNAYTTGSLGEYVQYNNGSVFSFWPASTNFETYLQFLYRSGTTTFYGTGLGTGYYSGTLVGSGYLNSRNLTGYLFTGYYKQLNSTVATGIPLQLITTGAGALFVYSTGQIIYRYSVPATGIERIIAAQGNGDDFTTGYLTGSLTGYVGQGSGTYRFKQAVIGRPYFNTGGYYFRGSHPGGSGANTGYYHTSINTTSHYGESSSPAVYTGYIDQVVTLTANMYNYPGLGVMTGFRPLSIYATSTGLITGFNLLTGSYAELTGSFSYVNSFLYNYADNGFRTGGYVKKSTTDSIGEGVHTVGLRILYDQNVPWDVRDYVRLSAKNQYTGSYLILEGRSITQR